MSVLFLLTFSHQLLTSFCLTAPFNWNVPQKFQRRTESIVLHRADLRVNTSNFMLRRNVPIYRYVKFAFHTKHHSSITSDPNGATIRGGPWPPLQYASRSLGPLLCLSIRLYPSFSGPWTRHPTFPLPWWVSMILNHRWPLDVHMPHVSSCNFRFITYINVEG